MSSPLPSSLRHEHYYTDQRRKERHQFHVVVSNVCQLVRDHTLQFVVVERIEKSFGDGYVCRCLVVSGGERIGIFVGNDPDFGSRQPRCDRHLLYDIDQHVFFLSLGCHQFPRPGRPQNFSWCRASCVPGDTHAEEGDDDADPGDCMVVLFRFGLNGQEIERQIPAESHPGKEQ